MVVEIGDDPHDIVGIEVILGQLGHNIERRDAVIVGGGERSEKDVGKSWTSQLLAQVKELLEVGPYVLVVLAPLIEQPPLRWGYGQANAMFVLEDYPKHLWRLILC